MSATDTLTEVKTYREDYGKGHRYFLDGSRVPGVTSILSAGWPKQLAKWGAESVASKAIDNWSKLSRMPVSVRLKALQSAPWEDIDRAGIKGSQVHALAEKIVRGESVKVPSDLAGYVKAHRRFLEDWQVRPELIERPVFSRKHGYAGTLDLAARLRDEKFWLLDIKTSRSGVWGDMSYQLTALRYADFMLDAEENEVPVPEFDDCGIVWLQADGEYQLYPMESNRKVYREFLAVMTVAEAVENAKAYRGDPLSAPVDMGEQ